MVNYRIRVREKFKKTLDYLHEIEKVDSRLYVKLLKDYQGWSRSLEWNYFQDFMEIVEVEGSKLGLPQYYGKLRAVALEEYIYNMLLKAGFKPLWKPIIKIGELKITPDIIVGEKVVECKVELDASRLKVALGEYLLLKTLTQLKEYILIYYKKELSNPLLEAVQKIIKIHYAKTFNPKTT